MGFLAEHRSMNWRTFWCRFLLSLGSLSDGYAALCATYRKHRSTDLQTIQIATTLGQPSFLIYMRLIDAEGKPVSNLAALTGAIVGLFCTGGCFGVLFSSWALDKFGRRSNVLILTGIYTICGILVAASQNIVMFIVARTIHGFGGISFVAAAAIYTAELSQAEARGFFTGLTGVAVAVGYLFAGSMGLAFSYTTNPTVQWRTPLALCLVPPTALVVALYFTPESPRLVLFKGRLEEAWEIVRRLHLNPTDTNDDYVREQFFQMQTQLKFDRTLNSLWKHLFKNASYRKRALMASLVTSLGQSIAVLVVAAYLSVDLRGEWNRTMLV